MEEEVLEMERQGQADAKPRWLVKILVLETAVERCSGKKGQPYGFPRCTRIGVGF